MALCEEIYLDAYLNNQYICLKDNNAQFYLDFPVYLEMPLIFTDFQQCMWWRPTSCWKICEYQIEIEKDTNMLYWLDQWAS